MGVVGVICAGVSFGRAGDDAEDVCELLYDDRDGDRDDRDGDRDDGVDGCISGDAVYTACVALGVGGAGSVSSLSGWS